MLKKDFNLKLYSVNDYHERINITNVNCGDIFMANNRKILPKCPSFVSHFFWVKNETVKSNLLVLVFWKCCNPYLACCVKSVRIRSFSGPYFPDLDWIRERIRTLFTQWCCLMWNAKINPFHATGLFLSPLKTSEIVCLSDILRGYRKRLVAWNGLKR